MYIYKYTLLHTHYTHIYTYTVTHMYTYTYIHNYTCIHIGIYKYTYIYIYTVTYTYTYTHTYVLLDVGELILLLVNSSLCETGDCFGCCVDIDLRGGCFLDFKLTRLCEYK